MPGTVFLDVDGTVTESCQVISGKMADLLGKFDPAFISGTDVPELKRMLPLKTPHWLLGCNGAEIVRYDRGYEGVWEASPLREPERIQAMLTLAGAFLCPEPFTDDTILHRKYQMTLSPLGRSAPLEEKRKFDPTGTKRRPVAGLLAVALDHHVSVGGTTSIDVCTFDKRRGLVNFRDVTGVEFTEYYGDGFPGNDDSVKGLMPCTKVNGPDHLWTLLK